ncbi:hypothetical protein O8F33_19400 [Enterobacter hormaechei subsp. xiangfangensis]|nr:hypothetical protein [Enterobacter hormaechei subsp. xiangfangensis]
MPAKNNLLASRDFVKQKQRVNVRVKKSTVLGVLSRLVLLAPVIFLCVFFMMAVYEHAIGL